MRMYVYVRIREGYLLKGVVRPSPKAEPFLCTPSEFLAPWGDSVATCHRASEKSAAVAASIF